VIYTINIPICEKSSGRKMFCCVPREKKKAKQYPFTGEDTGGLEKDYSQDFAILV
jgi:hypothetical protein